MTATNPTTAPDLPPTTRAESAARTGARRRGDVQGLRALAVGLVIADHLLGWPRGGFIGVDVFFVVSGYLITGLLLREYERTGHVSFRGFYRRRVKRIVPVATLVAAATALVAVAALGWTRGKGVVEDAVMSEIFLANWHFQREGVDYFAADLPPSPLQHYWSLAVEEQFYLVWPWLLLGLLTLGRRYLRLRPEHARPVAFTAIGVLTLASFVYAVRLTVADPTSAYFSTPSRAWELGVGALLAAAPAGLAMGSRVLRGVACGVGLAGIVTAAVVVSEHRDFPAPWALLPVLGTALVIHAGTTTAHRDRERPLPIQRVLTNRVAGYLGDISYSLYLWHWPVVVLLVLVVPKGSAAYLVGGLALTLVLSALSYRYLEVPARTGTWFRRRRPARGVYKYAAAHASVVVLCIPLALATTAMLPPTGPVDDVVLAGETDARPDDCRGAAALDPDHRCDGLNPGTSVTPSPREVTADEGSSFDCYGAMGAPPEECHEGPADGGLDVALVGDSHGASLLPGLVPQLDHADWSLTTYLGNGCRIAAIGSHCVEHLPALRRQLVEADHDLVLLTQSRDNGAADDVATVLPELQRHGVPVMVIGDVPDVPASTLECVERIGFAPGRDCRTDVGDALAVDDVLAREAARLGIPVVDTVPWLCREDSCPALIGNVLVYQDSGGHLTASYARTLGPYLVAEIAEKSLAARREVPNGPPRSPERPAEKSRTDGGTA